MSVSTISLSVQTLIESECLSTNALSFAQDPSGQPQPNGSPLRILNAVKLSLMLTKAFSQCKNDGKSNHELGSLGLDNFIIKVQYSVDQSRARGDQLLSSVDELNAIASTDDNQWKLVDMGMKYFDNAQISSESEEGTSGTILQSLGNLLHAIFSPKDALVPEAQDPNGFLGEEIETAQGGGKRRSANKSLFHQLIQNGLPISVCRLLSDLIDGGANSDHSEISVDHVIQDLEQMTSLPDLFLYDPDDEFFASTIHFGQKFYGRLNELAKLLEITTVTNVGQPGLETIFVSGLPGSGKTHLVDAVRNFVSNIGFMVLTAKFKRGMEYSSKEIVTTLMDEMVSNIVRMKESGNDADVDYSRRVARAITGALDEVSLSTLVDFVPNIQSLIPQVTKKEGLGCTHWQLIFLLSKLLRSVLSQERKIFMALDDLQWADPSTLGLISEVLISICHCPEERGRLVFVGMYRDNEVSDDLISFFKSLVTVEGGNNAYVTNVELSSLSLDDVTKMIMSELRLTRRMVSGLADVVHKRSHGHALFAVQLLNSLVSDSIIAYSPMLHRFHWDQNKISTLKTADSVACLIVFNLTLLSMEEIQCLRIISCFGIQVQSDLLELLEDFKLAPQGGFKSCLHDLVNQGIIEVDSTLIVFAHDLIQEQVYEGIPLKERRQLHCDIATFLSSRTSLDFNSANERIDTVMSQLGLSDGTDSGDSSIDTSSLISTATSQINNAGPEFFSDKAQLIRFASWNLLAGKDAAEKSSFKAALHFYKNGVAFLANHLWLKDTSELCLKLHEGATFSLSALGENGPIPTYANAILNNVNLDDSLVAEYYLIGSLTASGKCKEAIARGLAVLRRLNFDIAATPNPMAIMQAIQQAEKESSMYNFSQLSEDQKRVDTKTRNVMKLVEATSASCYLVASPFLPLLNAAAVRYSLQNGVCEDSASAFTIFAYFEIFLTQSFESGRKWGNVAKTLLEDAALCPATTRARLKFYTFVNFWFVPLKESIKHMEDVEDMGYKVGEIESADMAQMHRYKYSFFGGEQLSLLSQALDNSLRSMAKSSVVLAKMSALDKDLIDTLGGVKSSNPYAIFDGEIGNRQILLNDAQSKGLNNIVEAAHLHNVFLSFWMDDYEEAVKSSDIAMSFPSAKMPGVKLVYHIFYRGIIAYQLHRQGKGEKWLDEGNKMLDQVETWVKNSKPLFENKLVLLKAEQDASMCNFLPAKESYELSIKLARDNGYINEQGLAYERMGKYLMSIVEVPEAESCFLNAHRCYLQWGAKAKADKLWEDWNLGSSTGRLEPCTTSIKHKRNE
mmetsp:Transcript_29350/g.63181  ORF Transcript_29350/g.63181 Transcript_29350/m.63181 type:complete len:1300 (-) Transcript_29350:155-4054(-)